MAFGRGLFFSLSVVISANTSNSNRPILKYLRQILLCFSPPLLLLQSHCTLLFRANFIPSHHCTLLYRANLIPSHHPIIIIITLVLVNKQLNTYIHFRELKLYLCVNKRLKWIEIVCDCKNILTTYYVHTRLYKRTEEHESHQKTFCFT